MLLKKYSSIFFDLDHTLWDYERAMSETLLEMFRLFDLQGKGIERSEELIDVYRKIDFECWQLFLEKKIEKADMRRLRYKNTLAHFGLEDEELAVEMMNFFMQNCPRKPYAMPGAIPLLKRISGKYGIHIITNGLKEIQHFKLQHSGLAPFIGKVFVSDEVGAYKPDPFIFAEALRQTGSLAPNSLMVGDSLFADIIGARKAGMDQVFLNNFREKHSERVTLEIYQLSELEEWL